MLYQRVSIGCYFMTLTSAAFFVEVFSTVIPIALWDMQKGIFAREAGHIYFKNFINNIKLWMGGGRKLMDGRLI